MASKRSFLPEILDINSWEVLLPYCEELKTRKLNSKTEFLKWLENLSELEAVLEEDAAWRYIKMTIDTRKEDLANAYKFFITEIQPKFAPFEDSYNKIINDSPYIKDLENEKAFQIYFQRVRKAISLFRDENIKLEAETSELSQQYGQITGGQTIEHQGETLTLQQASLLLREQDENLRKEIFEKTGERRQKDTETLNSLFDKLIALRHQIAENAGFENYRDYKFESLCRFDYTKEDCFEFHKAIKTKIVPLVKKIQQKQADLLKVEKLKPWNLEVDPLGRKPLQPFKKGDELLTGSIDIFDKLDPYFGDCLRTMRELNYLDLESKPGKSPGGYNYPLYESGVPFIFMNAVGSQRDLVTMIHEGGHAVHSFLSKDLPLTSFKNLPSEVAELASMSMELISMKHWDVFYKDANDLKRAKIEQLESILKVLPWIATIDEFQHWIYENPKHTSSERTEQWLRITADYGTNLVDWSGYEELKEISWHRQLHLFEVPFYYIEYGIAQLGALSIWKNFEENNSSAIDAYKEALKLGYTKSIPSIYETANIKFDFSESYLENLAEFIDVQLTDLNQA